MLGPSPRWLPETPIPLLIIGLSRPDPELCRLVIEFNQEMDFSAPLTAWTVAGFTYDDSTADSGSVILLTYNGDPEEFDGPLVVPFEDPSVTSLTGGFVPAGEYQWPIP